MKKISAYLAYGADGPAVVLSKGHAKDLDPDYRTVTINYEGALSARLNENDRVWYVCSTLIPEHIDEVIKNQFYFDREEAIQAAKTAGAEDVGIWCTSYYYIASSKRYAAEEMPVRAVLRRNAKGLYCKLNLHPEEDGFGASGKIFFPDRSCASELCEGPVIIESVKDKGSYGFFTGRMVTFNAPSDKDLAKYLHDQSFDIPCTIKFMSGKMGTYVRLPSGANLAVSPDGFIFDAVDINNNNAVCVREVSGEDFVCEMFQGCTRESLQNKFVKYAYQGNRYHGCASGSALFHEAVEFGLLTVWETQSGVTFVEVDERVWMRRAVVQFSKEEFAELAEEVNKINNCANEVGNERLQRAKLRGKLSFGGAV